MSANRVFVQGGLRGGLAALAVVMGLAAPAAAQAPNIVQVAAGVSHTCAVDDAGGAWCWGVTPSASSAMEPPRTA